MKNADSQNMPVEIIRKALRKLPADIPQMALRAERSTLAKRRWRGMAEDGREFGFDLETPLGDGTAFFATKSAVYVLVQLPEPVFEVRFDGHAPRRVAEAGWLFGNLHFPIEVTSDVIRVADDPAVKQMLEREHIAFVETLAVFHPFKTGGHHHHAH